MGLFNLFGKKSKPAPEPVKAAGPNFAFVLLAQPQLPAEADFVKAFSKFHPGETLSISKDNDGEESKGESIAFHLENGGTGIVALMPAPVPNGEAEESVQYSVSAFGDHPPLPQHVAHLMVMFLPAPTDSPTDHLMKLTSIIAASISTAPAIGVYWGNAQATHTAEFFTDLAGDFDIFPRIMLWTGVSIARTEEGGISMLSMGMSQLGLPDLLLEGPASAGNGALEYMFNLLTYTASRGEAIGNGETVGRTAEEKLKVNYVPSPIDPKVTVWRVVLPS